MKYKDYYNIQPRRKDRPGVSLFAFCIIVSMLLCVSGIITLPRVTAFIGFSGDHLLKSDNTLIVDSEGTEVTVVGMETAAGSVYYAVYCIEKSKSPGVSYNTSLDDSRAGWGNNGYSGNVYWIMQNGYRGKLLSGGLDEDINGNSSGLTAEKAYIATQLAIWHFTDGYEPPVDLDGSVRTMYDFLVDGAKDEPPITYDPLSDVEIEIFFEFNGEYDVSTGFYGPVKLEVAYKGPYDDQIWGAAIPVTMTSLTGGELFDYEKKPLGTETTMYNGSEFYVDIGNPSGGKIGLVSAKASIDCTVVNSGFFFWSPDGTGIQGICGWGDYKVNTVETLIGRGECALASYIISGTKTIAGNPPDDEIFEFKLNEYENSSYSGSGQQVGSATSKGGQFSFTPIVLPWYQYETPGSSYYYTVQEVDGGDGDWVYDARIRRVKVDVDKDGTPEITYSGGDGDEIFNNTWQGSSGVETGELIVEKELAGSYEDWGVDNTTIFKASIKDVANNNCLLFKSVPEADGSYRCVGNDVDGLSETYTGDVVTEIPFCAGESVRLSNLWSGLEYRVEEKNGAHYTATYIGNDAVFSEGQNATVTVVNTYVHGTGKLVVKKSLAGSYSNWGVDNFTEFKVKIWDGTAGNYLIFKDAPEADDSYWCVGNEADGLSEPYSGTVVSELNVNAGSQLYLSNLWANQIYRVDENEGSNYIASYTGNSAMLPGSGDEPEANIIITVINTYSFSDVKPPDDSGGDRNGGGGGPTVTTPVTTVEEENKQEEETEESTTTTTEETTTTEDNQTTTDNRGGTNTRITSDNSTADLNNSSTPGGSYHDIPPNPVVTGHLIVPGIDDNTFVEFDEDGVPLGEWHWDNVEETWIFDEYTPLGDLAGIPDTGGDTLGIYLLLFGLSVTALALMLGRVDVYNPKP